MAEPFLIESAKETVDILEKLAERAKAGEFTEITGMVIRVDGQHENFSSKNENRFELVGGLMALMIERLGFQDRERTRWEEGK